jgi:hypothetical protein
MAKKRGVGLIPDPLAYERGVIKKKKIESSR